MDKTLHISQPLRSGKISFLLQSEDASLIQAVGAMWSPQDDPGPALTINIDKLFDDNPFNAEGIPVVRNAPWAVSLVRREIGSLYHDDLYLHGVVLINATENESLLLIGVSEAGKTTLALAMCYARNWKVFAEDIVFINIKNKLQATSNPMAVRQPTPTLLENLGVSLPPSPVPGWHFDAAIFAGDRPLDKIDRVIYIEQTGAALPFKCDIIPGMSFIRRILPASNAIYFDGGLERVAQALKGAQYLAMSGGALQERMVFLESRKPN